MNDNFWTPYLKGSLILLFSILCLIGSSAQADAAAPGQEIQIVDLSKNPGDVRTGTDEDPVIDYFFDDTCGSCKKVSPYISTITAKYPEVVINYHNLNSSKPDSKQERQLFNRFKLEYSLNDAYIPIIFFNGTAIQGDEQILKELEPAVIAGRKLSQPGEPFNIISFLKGLFSSFLPS